MGKQKIWTGPAIFEARTKKKLTQVELALRLGCRMQTISEWENGVRAPAKAYQRILTAELGGAK